MQPPHRSWLMHCSSLEPLQNCFTFCNSASQFNPSKRKLRYPPAQERWRTRTSSQVQWSKTKWTWKKYAIASSQQEATTFICPQLPTHCQKFTVWTLPLHLLQHRWFLIKKEMRTNWLHTTHWDTRNLPSPRGSRWHNGNSDASKWVAATRPPREQWN